MAARGENIHKRSDGRWEARVAIGTVNGKTQYKYLYGISYDEAKDKRDSYLIEHGLQTAFLYPKDHISEGATANTITFGETAEEWLKYKSDCVRESTLAIYTTMVRCHLMPELGALPLKDVTTNKISAVLKNKKSCGSVYDGAPMSDKTIWDLRAILRQILTYAYENGLLREIPKFPALSTRHPETDILSKQDQKILEQDILNMNCPFTLAFLISLYGGLRVGEVCALKWEDIDFKKGTVRVNKTVSRIPITQEGKPAGTRVVVGPPKTDCSIRVVPLPEPVMKYLSERRRDDSIYVSTGTEKYGEQRALTKRLQRHLKKLGLETHTWHCLRHTFATRCVESGVDIKSLSEIMGHSDVQITMQRYVHPTLDMKKEQINKLSCF